VQTPPALPPQPYAPADAHRTPPYNPWAIVSLSFAVSTVIGTWCFGGLVAVITGHIARQQIKRTGESGGSLALAGLVVGYVAIGLFFLFILAYILFFLFVFTIAATHSSPSPSPVPSAVQGG
jgi:quinol-cytochrome oxidoreductase complex cytochrome b subunit